MKFVNRRAGWHVEGKFIALIPAGVCPSDDEMLAYWHLRPGNARFADHAQPWRIGRCVLLKLNGNFLIAPLNPDVMEITA